MTMTPQQAAEVLRRHKEFVCQAHNAGLLPAALETAIAVMEATQPTDEQIGQLFDQYTDVSVLLNPISPTHAMTRTAFIQAVRSICNSK